LTSSALTSNLEFGSIHHSRIAIDSIEFYFNQLWHQGGQNLSNEDLEKWTCEVELARRTPGKISQHHNLPDYGARARQHFRPPIKLPVEGTLAPVHCNGYVKFFGRGNERLPIGAGIFEELERGGSHWALTYPNWGAPKVADGSRMYLARMTRHPDGSADTTVYSRAFAIAHDPEHDIASEDDIRLRPFKKRWSKYIRVYDVEFIDGTMSNGISLFRAMDELKEKTFRSTMINSIQNNGKNVDPRKSTYQKASLPLTAFSLDWLDEEFEKALEQHGVITNEKLLLLDWPKRPT